MQFGADCLFRCFFALHVAPAAWGGYRRGRCATGAIRGARADAAGVVVGVVQRKFIQKRKHEKRIEAKLKDKVDAAAINEDDKPKSFVLHRGDVSHSGV
jgi:hypothetical protein